jgi:glycosyltransferase involved in cell wall biosynthesis
LKLNYIAYYMTEDGYGRFNSRLVKALQELGVQVKPATMDHINMPHWMQVQEGIDWDTLTISSLPPYMLQPVPGRHWLLSMVEGSVLPPEWVDRINSSGVERVLVPCQHNADAFRSSGVLAPISILPGGTDPKEFPLLLGQEKRPYTFLTLGDRGLRKGWHEVWTAFYLAFGGKTTGNPNVRLIIKARPRSNGPGLIDIMASGKELDERIIYQIDDSQDMYGVYAQADCVALPSRCEGWGMPHREAASMGIPVITQAYSGLDDGYTGAWSLPVEGGKLKPIPKECKPSLGEWMVADIETLAKGMYELYQQPKWGKGNGFYFANWLKEYQTWQHSAEKLVTLMEMS